MPIIKKKMVDRTNKTVVVESGGRRCNVCTNLEVAASYFCRECDDHFCDTCREKHTSIEGIDDHEALPLEILCVVHPKKKLFMYCHGCHVFVCPRCVMRDHHQHKTEKIEVVSAGCRHRLQQILDGKQEMEDDVAFANETRLAFESAVETQMHIRRAMERVRVLWRQFGQKLDTLEIDAEAKLKSEIDTLSARVSDSDCLIARKQSVYGRVATLLDTASDMEVIVEEETFPNPIDLGKQDGLVLESLCREKMKRAFEGMVTNLEENIKAVQLHTVETTFVNPSPIINPKKMLQLKAGKLVTGIFMDCQRQQLVVRTQDTNAPIKLFTYSGKLLREMASDIDGIITVGNREICMDTKRDMYMVPLETSLKLLDVEGVEQDTIKVGRDLRGVAYCQENDLYVLSDVGRDLVYVINAASKEVVTQFGSRGSSDTKFNGPFSVCVGNVSGTDTSMIVVSDYVNQSVKIFDVYGNHVKTFNGKSQEDGVVLHPWGVAPDPAGRILVCDRNNMRVVSYWTEQSEDRWRRLLENLPDYNWTLAVDPIRRIIAVSVGSLVYCYRDTVGILD